MNLQEIEAFLAIVETRSITKAADQLYLSQSAISQRLKALEEDVEAVLFHRSKGHRTVMLTQRGEEFVSIANRWMNLHRDTRQFKKTTAYPTVTVACSDSMNLYIFSKLYNLILQDKVPISLKIKSHHYSIIYPLLDKREIDIGLVNVQTHYRNIISQPILSEPMFLVCSKINEFKTSAIHPGDLNPENELYIDWGPEYRRWHDYWLNPDIIPFLYINAPSIVFNFIQHPQTWAIVPVSMVKVFEKMADFEVYSILSPPPNRICYKITNKFGQPGNNSSLGIFETKLESFLSTIEWRI